MVTPNSADEARLLQDLLADAHARIRELQSRVDQLADELITVKVNDRRCSIGSHSNVERERRRAVVHAIESQRERIDPRQQVG
jgi:hypothetical protein